MPARTAAQGPPHKHDELFRQVTDSEIFQSAPTMRALLVYLWTHQGEQVSEYAIATEALGRSPDFDPKSDSTVRVHIARLRSRLKEFQEAAGETFPLRLSLPLGQHELSWTYQRPHKSLISRLRVFPRRYLLAVALTELALVAACVVLLIQNHSLRGAIPPTPAPLPRFWQSFLVPGKSTTIVLPSPLYFFWPSHQVYVRDLQISEFANWPTSPFLKATAAQWGPPELSQIYLGAMEMTAGVKLLQYLEKDGQQVQLTESRRFPGASLPLQNTILLGMPRTATYLNKMLEKTNFVIERVSPDLIRNRNPRAGEPATFEEVTYSADRRLGPAMIVLLPVRPEHTRTLLLLGRNLTSITSMLLSLEGLKSLDELWAKSGSPDAWEAVIQADIYRDTVLKTTPVALRAIPPTFWN